MISPEFGMISDHRNHAQKHEHIGKNTADARADLVTIVATRAESDEVLDAVLRLMPVDLRGEFARQFASGEIVPVIPVDVVGEAELHDLLNTLSG
jgi:hypothetical protein